MDHEGFEQWKEEHPQPSDADYEVALMRFFRQRPDMTAEDFMVGRDPKTEEE